MCFSVLDPISLPATPGMDFIGVVTVVGSAVTEWKEGDRVAGLVQTGANARYIVVPQTTLMPVPRYVDASDAVCLISTYMTAYQSLKMAWRQLGCVDNGTDDKDQKDTRALPLQGKRLLIVGGIDPVCQALIQLAKHFGADQVYCTAPSNKHSYIKSVLKASPVPMDTKDWLLLMEGSIDIVFDQACQDGFDSSRKALKKDGALICVGMHALLQSESVGTFGAPLSAYWTQTKARYFMSNTQFYQVLPSFHEHSKAFRSDLAKVFALLKDRVIKPHISKRISLGDVPEAQADLENGKARGVVVCLPWRRRSVAALCRTNEKRE